MQPSKKQYLEFSMVNKSIILAVMSAVTLSSLAQTPMDAPSPNQNATPVKSQSVPVDVFSFKQAPSEAAMQTKRAIENLHTVKARIALAEARAKLADVEKNMHQSKSDAMQPVKLLPKVVSVIGKMGNLSAQIVFAGGTVRNIRKGDVLGSMTVHTITMDEVILRDDTKTRISLPFSTHLSIEEAVKESLATAPEQTSGFLALPKMTVLDGPLPPIKN
jgi:type IV pilus biogenesis protein PilP